MPRQKSTGHRDFDNLTAWSGRSPGSWQPRQTAAGRRVLAKALRSIGAGLIESAA
jgi:hypothetical protein